MIDIMKSKLCGNGYCYKENRRVCFHIARLLKESGASEVEKVGMLEQWASDSTYVFVFVIDELPFIGIVNSNKKCNECRFVVARKGTTFSYCDIKMLNNHTYSKCEPLVNAIPRLIQTARDLQVSHQHYLHNIDSEPAIPCSNHA